MGAALITGPAAWTIWSDLFTNNAWEACHNPEDAGGDSTQVLYAYFGRSGQTLYVGVTGSMSARHRAHERSSPWFPLAAGYFWTSDICCRRCVLTMEREAIRTFDPIYNIAGKARR